MTMPQLVAMKKLDWGCGPPYQPVFRTLGLYFDPTSHKNFQPYRRFYLEILNANSSKTWVDDDFAKQWAIDAGTPYDDIKHLFDKQGCPNE